MGSTPGAAPRRDERETPHTAGLTTALMLAHVEQHGGRAAVSDLLSRIGKPELEASLRDERTWWHWDTKIAMFEAAADILGDPEVTRTAGAAALEMNVGSALKAGLRALGSPGLVYGNIVRAQHKFSTSAAMVLDELHVHRARIRYTLVEDLEPHRLDCLYNQGLLSCVPVLFGLEAARIEHPVCALDGGEDCIYEVTWQPQLRPRWRAMAASGLAAAAVVAGTAAVAAPALPAVAAAAAAGAAWLAGRRRQQLIHAVRDLEREIDVRTERNDRVRTSLHALASALQQDELVARVTEHAATAIGGYDTVLLLDGPDGLRAQRSVYVAEDVAAAMEQWATRVIDDIETVTAVDDLAGVPELDWLPARKPPVASLCVAPLRARDARLGLLVSMAPRAYSFLPQEIAVMQLFAEQASVALANSRMYAALEEMATRDPLTGLRNHREFHDAVAGEVSRSRRSGARFSVALLDLDGFKGVNDVAGHAAGDQLLARFGATLAAAARGGDTVFRVGGDEFAILLPETGGDEAERAVDRVAGLAADTDSRVGASYGVSTWPDDGREKADVLARADERLYAMKRTRYGRSRVATRRPRRRRVAWTGGPFR